MLDKCAYFCSNFRDDPHFPNPCKGLHLAYLRASLASLSAPACRNKVGTEIRIRRQVAEQKPNSPSEPHDALFRALTGDALSSESLIRRFAPPELVRVLSGKPPRLLDGTLVRPELRKFHVDALFQVEVRGGDSVFVQVLYEHLSSPSPGCGCRNTWAAVWLQRDSNIALRTLYPIKPVVICHGPRRRVVPESFMELIDVPEALAGKLPFSNPASRSMILAGYRTRNLRMTPRREERSAR